MARGLPGASGRRRIYLMRHGEVDGDIVRRFIRTFNFTPYDPVKNGKYLTNMEMYRDGRSG